MTTEAPPAPVSDAATGAARRADEAPTDRITIITEVALTVVTLALVANVGRLFTDSSYFPKLALTAIAAHAVASARRRIPLPAALSFAVPIVTGVVFLTVLHYSAESTLGLPNTAVARALRSDLADAFGPFRTLVAPVAMSAGFAVALGAAIWLVGHFADLAAFGGDAPVQAIIPHVAGFVFVSILANGRGSAAGAVQMGVAVALFLLSVRARRRSRLRWVRGEADRGATSLVLTGAVIVVAAALAGVLAEPFVPGADSKGLVDLRKLGRQSERRLASPIISVQNLLTEQSNDVAFTVDADQPHYWRLTALEQPVGFKWSSADSNYADVDGGDRLAGSVADGALGERTTATFSVRALGGIWLPAPYEPRRVSGDDSFRFNDTSSSLILATDGNSLPALTYAIEATPPLVADAAAIDEVAAQGGGPGDPDDRYELVPADTPEVLIDQARETTRDADTPVRRALALQAFFRDGDFAYDKTADYSADSDPFSSFLERRQGFCQQFATTFALMARVVGLPSRVAVGFTFGEPNDPQDPSTWTVRGRHAHAWPEVFIRGVGWLPFEPTPGRGNPDAGYTGVGTAQDDTTGVVNDTGTGAGNTTTTTTPRTTIVGAPATTAPTPTTGPRRRQNPQIATPEESGSAVGTSLAIIGTVVGAGAVLAALGLSLRWLFVRRRRQRRRDALRSGASGAVRLAWRDTCDALATIGVRRSAAETPVEFARRAARDHRIIDDAGLGADLAPGIERLGLLESCRAYAPPGLIDDDDEDFAVELAATISQRCRQRTRARERVGAGLGLGD